MFLIVSKKYNDLTHRYNLFQSVKKESFIPNIFPMYFSLEVEIEKVYVQGLMT